MRYTAFGEDGFCSWQEAARRGGSTPEHPVPGEMRTYRVDAWLDVPGRDPVNITGAWLSQLADDVKKAYLKEFGLPIKKAMVFRDFEGEVHPVADIKVTDVWDGWCNLAVKLSDGTVPALRIHSMYFAEMNSSAGATGDGTAGASSEAKRAASSPAPQRRRPRKPKQVRGMPLDIVVFDLESTGLDCQRDEICELAALKVVDGEVAGEFEQLVYIDGEMPRGAERVNHISKEMLTDAPHMTAALSAFLEFIGRDAVLVGHNIKAYDLPFIERVARLCGLTFTYAEAIDTLELARRAWRGLRSYSMDSLRERLKLEGEGAHRALKDCYDELALYQAIRKDVAAGLASIEPRRKTSARAGGAPSAWGRKKAKDFVPTVETFDESHPLFDKHVVISGEVTG